MPRLLVALLTLACAQGASHAEAGAPHRRNSERRELKPAHGDDRSGHGDGDGHRRDRARRQLQPELARPRVFRGTRRPSFRLGRAEQRHRPDLVPVLARCRLGAGVVRGRGDARPPSRRLRVSQGLRPGRTGTATAARRAGPETAASQAVRRARVGPGASRRPCPAGRRPAGRRGPDRRRQQEKDHEQSGRKVRMDECGHRDAVPSLGRRPLGIGNRPANGHLEERRRRQGTQAGIWLLGRHRSGYATPPSRSRSADRERPNQASPASHRSRTPRRRRPSEPACGIASNGSRPSRKSATPPSRAASLAAGRSATPARSGFRFCEAPALVGKPYCPEHAELAYVRIRDRREDGQEARRPGDLTLRAAMR